MQSARKLGMFLVLAAEDSTPHFLKIILSRGGMQLLRLTASVWS